MSRDEDEGEEDAPLAEIIGEVTGTVNDRIRAAENIAALRGALEAHARVTNTRLRQGAREFEDLRRLIDKNKASLELHTVAPLAARIEKLTEPTSKWTILGTIAAIVVVVAGVIWNASRYPERGEFSDLRRMAEQRTSDLTLAQTLAQRDLADLREAVKRLEGAQASTSSKVDQLLLSQGHKP